ncbi:MULTISPECIES: cell wall metabolism sensor histidine kinase WalK [unclassified Saccharopolyspora]|uniref:sensor histidine kinase n=1 Tax=unclassified Saccharopolyspora TaxID=2646250 RepID=UPI001CD469CA|nr:MULTISPECIES: HAMP domain-containing sensor histidine kinase [unclassified Saccharopolyspora]MCA1190429.1 HAMP domain-containing histidine kinase [Saccharopolyspora sp. 6T]MCA1229909.1 HAMP domain-containing histidine kinase [Saccharopolyspora sp. 6M]MCA1281892.1 HAMP domain-containing histidine kinase [Saccharopolyspora sp. 7B]
MSLRARVLLIAVGLLAAGLAIGGAVVIGALERNLVGKLDAQLAATATAGARIFQVPDAGLPGPGTVVVRDNFALPGSTTYAARLGAGGAVTEQEWTGERLPGPDLTGLTATAGPVDVPSRDGTQHWRLLAQPGRDELVVTALSRAEVDDTVARMRAISAGTATALLAVLALAGWFAVRAGLRPLRRIERTSAAIAAGDLGSRVPESAGPDTEVGRLSRALNAMLDRNEAAFAARAESEARMRRFVADAGHELRTPLAGIKGFSKLHRMGAVPAGVDAMSRIERESDRLERLVDDLLLLARLDERLPLQLAPMDLRTLAADALHDVHALDPSRPAELTGPGGGPPAAAPALADEERLRQVVTNLVGNAVRHTPEGTPVRIGVGSIDGRAVLEVADDGPGLAPEEAERVFQRFYRSDGSRSRASGGAGLGLAIVRSLVEAHDGRVELATAPGAGTCFRVVLDRVEISPATGAEAPRAADAG